jgi:hypothetical protein
LRSICSYFVYEIPRIVCPSSDLNVTHMLVYATKNTYGIMTFCIINCQFEKLSAVETLKNATNKEKMLY